MDNKTLKELASHIGSEIREQVGVAHDRIDELAADVAALPEVQHGRDGKDGEPGPQGQKGDPGESIVGPQGEQGPAGESIVGPQGEKGEKGDDGESIVGPQGERGEKGDPGESIEGPQGAQGIQGEKGDTGDTGTGIDVPFWSADEVYREGVEVQHHFGQFFRAKKDTAESPDDPESWERVGSSGFRLTGAFSKDAEYRDGDLFVKDFGLFLHNSGKSTLIAGRGPEGKKGKPGATGRDGKDGADGKDGQDGADGSLIEALELRGANLVAVFKNADGTVKDHSVSLDPFLQTAALVTKEAAETEKKSIIDEADQYVRKLWGMLNQHLDDDTATPISYYRGIWKIDRNYRVGDWVRYGSEAMLCTRDNIGVTPHNFPTSKVDSSEYWTKVAGDANHSVWQVEGEGGGTGGITPLDVMVKEGGQGGVKWSQFPVVTADATKQFSVVGLQEGANVQAVLTTDLVATNPDVTFRDGNGRFRSTADVSELTDQLKVNRWIANELEAQSEAIDNLGEKGYDDTELRALIDELPVTVSTDAPDIEKDGQLWYDDDRLELFVSFQNGWISTTPLAARIESGEELQAEILRRVEAGEAMQSGILDSVYAGEALQSEIQSDVATLQNKVIELEGVVGEYTYNYNPNNANARDGDFCLKDGGMQVTNQLSNTAFVELGAKDNGGKAPPFDTVSVGDVMRFVGANGDMFELRVTESTMNLFAVDVVTNPDYTMNIQEWGVVLLSSFDPAGLATVSYVDAQDALLATMINNNGRALNEKVSKSGNQSLDKNSAWKLKQQRQDGSDATFVSINDGEMHLYHVATPSAPTHAANMQYVDDQIADIDVSGYLPLTGGTLTGELKLKRTDGVSWWNYIRSEKPTAWDGGDSAKQQLHGLIIDIGATNTYKQQFKITGRNSKDLLILSDDGNAHAEILGLLKAEEMLKGGKAVATEEYVDSKAGVATERPMLWKYNPNVMANELGNGEFNLSENPTNGAAGEWSIYFAKRDANGQHWYPHDLGHEYTHEVDVQLATIRGREQVCAHGKTLKWYFNQGTNKYARLKLSYYRSGSAMASGKWYLMTIPGYMPFFTFSTDAQSNGTH